MFINQKLLLRCSSMLLVHALALFLVFLFCTKTTRTGTAEVYVDAFPAFCSIDSALEMYRTACEQECRMPINDGHAAAWRRHRFCMRLSSDNLDHQSLHSTYAKSKACRAAARLPSESEFNVRAVQSDTHGCAVCFSYLLSRGDAHPHMPPYSYCSSGKDGASPEL